MSHRNFGLDLLRAIAIMAVLGFHASPLFPLPEFLSAIAARGWMGVDLFFVLSGYLIGQQTLSLADRPNGPFFRRCTTFWIKRWTRTVPLYVVVLFCYLVVKPAFLHAPFVGGFNWKWLVFSQNFGQVRDFGQSWSLCIEEQFYFVFPLIAFSCRRMPRLFWLLPLVISVALRLVVARHLSNAQTGEVLLTPEAYVETFRFPTFMMLDAISVGVFLASCRPNWNAWPRTVRQACAPIGALIVGFVGCYLPQFPTHALAIALMYTALAIGFGALLVAAEQWQYMPAGLWFVQWIALCSYSVYLWHEMFTRFFDRYVHYGAWQFQLFAYLVFVMAFSKLSYEWVEKPGISLRQRIFRQPEAR